MNNDYLIWGNIDSRDYNVCVFRLDTDGGADREQDVYDVPGRDGSLTSTITRLKNTTQRYMGVIYENAERNLKLFRDAMTAQAGYHRLEDSVNDEEFYQARITAAFAPTIPRGRDMCKFAIEFDRKPQRWLKSGETNITFTESGTIVNPTMQTALPLIRVQGYGRLAIGSVVMTVADDYDFIYIDCEMMDCYRGSANVNSSVTLTGNYFPSLPAGETGIEIASTITRLDIWPRWWRA